MRMLVGAGITEDGAAGAHYFASQGGTSVTITGARAVDFRRHDDRRDGGQCHDQHPR
jgi:hypothetical protein